MNRIHLLEPVAKLHYWQTAERYTPKKHIVLITDHPEMYVETWHCSDANEHDLPSLLSYKYLDNSKVQMNARFTFQFAEVSLEWRGDNGIARSDARLPSKIYMSDVSYMLRSKGSRITSVNAKEHWKSADEWILRADYFSLLFTDPATGLAYRPNGPCGVMATNLILHFKGDKLIHEQMSERQPIFYGTQDSDLRFKNDQRYWLYNHKFDQMLKQRGYGKGHLLYEPYWNDMADEFAFMADRESMMKIVKSQVKDD